MRTRVAFLGVLIAIGGMVTAQARTYRVDIPPQPLDRALEEFAEQSELQVVYLAEIVEGIDSTGFSGEGTVDDVLPVLLEGSGLAWRFENERTVSIVESAEDDDAGAEAAGPTVEAPKGDTRNNNETARPADPKPGQVKTTSGAQAPAGNEPAAQTEAPAAEEATAIADQRRKFTGEVTVTASRREESVRDLAANVSVIDGRSLEEKGAAKLEDYIQQNAGVNFNKLEQQ